MTKETHNAHIANLIVKEELKEILSHNILKLIKERENNKSLFTMNARLGLSDATLHKYVTRGHLPQLHILVKIADFFDVTLDKLVREKF